MGKGGRPGDNPIMAAFRFIILILAIVSWPLAMTLHISLFFGIVSAVSIGFTAIFFTNPEDVKRVFIPTPGPIRALIELLLHLAAMAGSVIAWPPAAGILVAVVLFTSLLIGLPRLIWLLKGARPPEPYEPLPDYYDHLIENE